MNDFLLSAYRFDLPSELIAEKPLNQRTDSRLMVISKDHPERPAIHTTVNEIHQHLPAGTLCIANNSKVFKARLLGKRLDTGGKVEFFLLKELKKNQWQGLMRATARIEPGFKFQIQSLTGTVVQRIESKITGSESEGATFVAEFDRDPIEFGNGEVPLPPYIVAKRNELGLPAFSDSELEIYNTVFASEVGSVAAPTAGRHFDHALIQKLKSKGFDWQEITLHVGLGTFKSVVKADIREHSMHPETIRVEEAVTQKIKNALECRIPILAIGTTSARCLEAGYDPNQKTVPSGTRDVNAFFYPGCGKPWNVVQGLMTNFHLPESTLIMMVADFLGSRSRALQYYQEAIEHRYRFYSYGDAMLII
jgi:S-adenosylmethionine:tRNA ribosyltransferase-isomerase